MLAEIISQKIVKEGAISFRDFMDMCLYFPEYGYYTSSKEQIGKKGDYFTSSSVSEVFGAMIAKQVEEMWNVLGKRSFTLVEFGAGQGLLCHDILDYLKQHNSILYSQLQYCIIEKSPVMIQRQKNHLFEKVTWCNTIRELGEIEGCFISNEVIDNFPVHQVLMKDELMEFFVDYNGEFIEVLKPAGEALTNYLRELNVSLPPGFRTEINLDATEWLKEIGTSLKRGYVLTIDYGGSSLELYSERRKRGTLVCFHNHTVNEYPYHAIGEQDITAHVNFSALSHWGRKNGLNSYALINQAQFLLALGFKEYLREIVQGNDLVQSAKKEAFLTQTFLLEMGMKFKVLIQEKGNMNIDLSGLKFAKQPDSIQFPW
jgi:SAM-dependent MidA family methyltransferase